VNGSQARTPRWYQTPYGLARPHLESYETGEEGGRLTRRQHDHWARRTFGRGLAAKFEIIEVAVYLDEGVTEIGNIETFHLWEVRPIYPSYHFGPAEL